MNNVEVSSTGAERDKQHVESGDVRASRKSPSVVTKALKWTLGILGVGALVAGTSFLVRNPQAVSNIWQDLTNRGKDFVANITNWGQRMATPDSASVVQTDPATAPVHEPTGTNVAPQTDNPTPVREAPENVDDLFGQGEKQS